MGGGGGGGRRGGGGGGVIVNWLMGEYFVNGVLMAAFEAHTQV